MQFLTVPTAAVLIISLSIIELAFARPIVNLLAPLESKIIRMTEVAGVNTTSIDIHHIFQTIDLMQQANKAAMFSMHPDKLNRTIDTEHGLCSFVSNHHHNLITNLKGSFSKYVNGNTTTETTTTTTTTTDATKATDEFIYRSCMKFVVKGMRYAKVLAQQMAAAEKASTPSPNPSTTTTTTTTVATSSTEEAQEQAQEQSNCPNGETYDADSTNCVVSITDPGAKKAALLLLEKRKWRIGPLHSPAITFICGAIFPFWCNNDDKSGYPWLDDHPENWK